MIIYLDESGDLGFDFKNKKPSNKFVITLLVCKNKLAVDDFKKAVNRALKNKLNHKKDNNRRVDEFHATSTTFAIKQYFYRQLNSTSWCLYTVVLNKSRVYENLTTKAGRKKLYNYLANFLIQKVEVSTETEAVTLVVDKCKNKQEIADFNSYLTNQLEARLPLKTPLYIHHEDSKANTGLQAVDCFCWGIYRKYEHNDDEWYCCYADRIVFETEYLGV